MKPFYEITKEGRYYHVSPRSVTRTLLHCLFWFHVPAIAKDIDGFRIFGCARCFVAAARRAGYKTPAERREAAKDLL